MICNMQSLKMSVCRVIFGNKFLLQFLWDYPNLIIHLAPLDDFNLSRLNNIFRLLVTFVICLFSCLEFSLFYLLLRVESNNSLVCFAIRIERGEVNYVKIFRLRRLGNMPSLLRNIKKFA